VLVALSVYTMGRLTAMKIIPLVISLTTFWVTGVNFMAPPAAKNLSSRINCDPNNHGGSAATSTDVGSVTLYPNPEYPTQAHGVRAL